MNKLVSPANSKNDNKLELSEMSFTYNKNNEGPKIDSWGTPQVPMEFVDLMDL